MRISLDDDSASRQLSAVLRKAGHDVRTPVELGTAGAADPAHLMRAIQDSRCLLTRNARDFIQLHDLIVASGGSHPGILVVHSDNDPTRDMTSRGIVTAIARLESSGLSIPDQIHVLNRWR